MNKKKKQANKQTSKQANNSRIHPPIRQVKQMMELSPITVNAHHKKKPP